MRFQPRRTEEPEINLTSLIDVVLLLVIFFMVSTSFTVDGRLRLQLPGSSAVPERQAAELQRRLRSALRGRHRIAQ